MNSVKLSKCSVKECPSLKVALTTTILLILLMLVLCGVSGFYHFAVSVYELHFLSY
jgi:hypothetical protein